MNMALIEAVLDATISDEDPRLRQESSDQDFGRALLRRMEGLDIASLYCHIRYGFSLDEALQRNGGAIRLILDSPEAPMLITEELHRRATNEEESISMSSPQSDVI